MEPTRFSIARGPETGKASGYPGDVISALLGFALLYGATGLGLVDPVVADRFRLWSISTTTITLGFVVFLAGRLLTENVGETAWVLGATSLVGLVAGSTMWIAFFPPARYLRRFAPSAPT